MKNNLPEVASPIQYPVIGKKFTPAKHPNDRVKLAYAKRHVENPNPTSVGYSLKDLQWT